MNCIFCDFENEIKYRLLKETKNFYLIPALGAFIEGYLLIISKEHYENLSQLSLEMMNEVIELENIAIKFLKETYNLPVLEYEHGGCTIINENAGACVNHLHLVLVATKKDPLKQIIKDFGTGKKIKNLKWLKQLQNNFASYLLYKKNNTILYWKGKRIISQYMRRIMSKCMPESKKNVFDWHIFRFEQNIKKIKIKWDKWLKNK